MVTSLTGRGLVVDDEVDLARLIEGCLRAAGLEAAARHTRLQAVAAVREFVPDVVVLDLGLLVEMVWDAHWTGDIHLGRIRRKLGEDAVSPRFIHTVRGIGYRLGARR
jgi:DNA-binding response OmpR family regulator